MSRGLVTGGPHLFTNSAIHRLWAAGPRVHTIEELQRRCVRCWTGETFSRMLAYGSWRPIVTMLDA